MPLSAITSDDVINPGGSGWADGFPHGSFSFLNDLFGLRVEHETSSDGEVAEELDEVVRRGIETYVDVSDARIDESGGL